LATSFNTGILGLWEHSVEILGIIIAGFWTLWGLRKALRLAQEEARQGSLLALGGAEVPYRVSEGFGKVQGFLRSRWTLGSLAVLALLWFLFPLFVQQPEWFQSSFFWVVPSFILWAVPDFLRANSDVSVWRLGEKGWIVRGQIWPWESVHVEHLHHETEGFILSFRPLTPSRSHLPPVRILRSDLDPQTAQFLDKVVSRR
jgi:hypothetical protein